MSLHTTDDPCSGCEFSPSPESPDFTQCTIHPQIPAYLQSKIDQDSMSGSVKPYALHILICLPTPTSGKSWPERIEDLNSRGAIFRDVTNLHSTAQNDSVEYLPSIVFAGINMYARSSASRVMSSVIDKTPGQLNSVELLVLPDFRTISFSGTDKVTPESVFSSIKQVIEPVVKPVTNLSSYDTQFTGEFQSKVLKSGRYLDSMEIKSDLKVDEEDTELNCVILVCTHKKRDKRCGVSGPLLSSQFEMTASEEKMKGVGVYGVSHIGGHRWAGNILIYTKDPISATWYGRVKTCHVESILKRTVMKGEVFDSILRGGMAAGDLDSCLERRKLTW
ncbi:hypothetical protein HK098_000129 [Nowakowskiella sp. JEL0407]|nr:hypothetical protein HK098_000129 [Nowakowskiella sp. JEL0407]